GRRHLRSQNLDANPFLQEKLLEPPRHVPLPRIDGEHVDLSAYCKLTFDLFDQPPLFRVDEVLVQIRRLRNDESFTLPRLRISVETIERSQSKGPVRIQQKRVHGGTDNRGVAVVLAQRIPDVILKPSVSLFQHRI